MTDGPTYTRRFAELGIGDVPSVGGKTAGLGEMYRSLSGQGVRVPDGFAITADAYRHVIRSAGALGALHEALDGLDPTDLDDLARRAARARAVVYDAGLPDDLTSEIVAGYRHLQEEYGEQVGLAVRSSGTAEDLPTASFAGQQETFLNIRGEQDLLGACRKCFASLFTGRSVHYRVDQGFDQFQVALSIAVMKMVRSDLASSGVLFTLDTESGFRDVVFVTGTYGLGETIVQGAVDPDEFYVHKPSLASGHRAVLRRRLGEKAIHMVLADGSTGTDGATTTIEPTPEVDRGRFCLDDADVLELADTAMRIEAHFGHPMDIEWAKDGVDGMLYIVQARPETVMSQRGTARLETFVIDRPGEVIVQGRAVGQRIAAGKARVITDAANLDLFRPGEVLVAEITTPDWEPVMKTAAAIVTDRGGRTCHAAIIARELGIPAVVGARDATSVVPDGEPVTVSCSEGETGSVYRGEIGFHVETHEVDTTRPSTEIMVNLGNPDIAFTTSFLPNDGVGLARMEFIISESIRAHPLALLHPDRVTDPTEREEIGPAGAGLRRRCPVLRPAPVRRDRHHRRRLLAQAGRGPHVGLQDQRVRAPPGRCGLRARRGESDARLPGRVPLCAPGVRRGLRPRVAAMVRVRGEMGLTNVVLMLPFVRRVAEAHQVLDRMAELGLRRGADGLEVYAMCEIPNNVILIDRFAPCFDGFSIGSNDLTQLTLGVDRDSEIVAFDYDERDEGVKEMIRMAVEGCRRNGLHSGLCGQAPSDYPDMAEFLVELGIDSMSLNPDSVLATTGRVLEVEARLGRAPRSPHRSSRGPARPDPSRAGAPGPWAPCDRPDGVRRRRGTVSRRRRSSRVRQPAPAAPCWGAARPAPGA